MPIPLTEKQLQNSIFEHLIHSGFIAIRVNAGAAWMKNKNGKKRFVRFVLWAVLGRNIDTKGIADLLGLSPRGKFYAFEIKIPGNHASKEQLEFLQLVREHGGVGEVVFSLDRVIELVNDELGNVLF